MQSIAEYYRVLQSITGYCRLLTRITECYRVPQSITEYYRLLQSITEYYRVLQSIESITKTNLAHLLGPIFGLVGGYSEFLEVTMMFLGVIQQVVSIELLGHWQQKMQIFKNKAGLGHRHHAA